MRLMWHSLFLFSAFEDICMASYYELPPVKCPQERD
jgi:hypothetical protein